MSVTCGYCSRTARLVSGAVIYPHRADLRARLFWQCSPCDAWVGCHPKGQGKRADRPLGRLANAGLRQAKRAAHAAFDPIWKDRHMSRSHAYAWLAGRLGIPKAECHIGMMDEAQCMAVKHAATQFTQPANYPDCYDPGEPSPLDAEGYETDAAGTFTG